MKSTLLIVNNNSGSAAAVGEEELLNGLRTAGFDPAHIVRLPDDDLPDRAAVEAAGAEVVAILSGDGTIAGMASNLARWSGSILVLPGGTMNLLSRRLHGEATVPELLQTLALQSFEASPVSVIKANEQEIYTGLIAGPSTEWGKVREGMRQFDVGELLEKIPEAWSATTEKESVRLEGMDEGYPAIFVEPLESGKLGVLAFKADGIADMFAHGFAWLRRDFRDGPSHDLGEMREAVIVDEDKRLGLLVDGEQGEASSPFHCVAAMSSVKFIRTQS